MLEIIFNLLVKQKNLSSYENLFGLCIYLFVFQKKKIKRRKSKFFNQPNFPLGKSIKLKLILQIARGQRNPYIEMEHSS